MVNHSQFVISKLWQKSYKIIYGPRTTHLQWSNATQQISQHFLHSWVDKHFINFYINLLLGQGLVTKLVIV